jgi:hypothetical protein
MFANAMAACSSPDMANPMNGSRSNVTVLKITLKFQKQDRIYGLPFLRIKRTRRETAGMQEFDLGELAARLLLLRQTASAWDQ